MQQLLASLVVAMSVQDVAFTTGMAEARKNAARTGQEFEQSGERMGSALERAAVKINAAMISIADAVADANRKVIAAGAAMTIGLTVPLALAGKSAKDTAATFESAMNGVRAAMLTATPDQINKLSDAALAMGPAFGKSASEAAAAIEALAKTGLSAADILNGGLKSALTLAVVGQTDMGRATAITTDIMAQFGRQASELPGITDRVVGALDATKMGANDYAQAIGQVGGIAGGLGYAFEDTNVAIAALSTSFDSGSSAGTALKSMLLQLKPTTEEAKEAFDKVGQATTGTAISFFDADNKAKSFAETAEILRNTFGRLNEESKREALTKAFGSDGMAAALALIDKGAAGMAALGKSIDGVTADEKLAVMMQGDAVASQRLSSAIEVLSIKIGNILLPIFTAVKNAAADMIQWMSNLPSAFHYTAAAVGGLVAMIGPLVTALGIVAKVAVPLLLARFAVVPIVLGLIINPLGLVIGLIGRLAVAMGAAAVIGTLGARFLALAGPIGLVISLTMVLIPLLNRKAIASAGATAATEAAARAADDASEAEIRLAGANDKARRAIIDKAKADQWAAGAALKKALADEEAARQVLLRAKAEQVANVNRQRMNVRGAGGGTDPMMIAAQQSGQNIDQAYAEWVSRRDTRRKRAKAFGSIRNIIESDVAPPTAGVSVDFSDAEKKKKSPKGRDAARDNAQYLDELGRLRVAALEAQADLTGSIEARYRADMAGIAEERASFARNIALDEGLTDAKRATLLAAQEAVLDRRAQQADQARTVALEQDRYELQVAAIEAQQDIVRSEIDAADSIAARRAGQLRLLALDRQHEEAVLDQILATKKTTDIEWSKANARKGQLDAIYADREAATRRDNEGPLASWRRDLNRSAEAVNESIEAIEVSGFERLNDWMTDAVLGADNLAQSFRDMASSIIRDLMRIVIQQQLIRPLANALGGGAEGGGILSGLFKGAGSVKGLVDTNPDRTLPDMQKQVGLNLGGGFGGLLGLGRLFGLGFGGGKASGGRVSPGNWYMVGEHGPEPFVPDTAGTIRPTASLRGGRGGGQATIRIVEDAGFASRVVGISGDVSVQTSRATQKRRAMQSRQRIA